MGGQCANLAAGTALAGQPIEFVGLVGEDASGRALKETLESEGVMCGGIVTAPGPTAWCIVVTDEGERRYPRSDKGPYVTRPFAVEELPFINDEAQVHLDFSTVHLLDPLTRRRNLRISMDYRRVWLETATVFADVSFVSLDPEDTPEAVARMVESRLGANLLVMTCGAGGSYAFRHGTLIHQPTRPIAPVDSTGAGDAYQCGFLMEYLASGDLRAAMEAGTEWGIRACGRLGASLGELRIPDATRLALLDFAARQLGSPSTR